MKIYFQGLRFGMLLQLAIGPMCLMVFNTAQNYGFLPSLSLVLAIALVDAFYITLAGFGISRMLQKKKIKNIFKISGSAVLILFGINMISGVYGISLIPGLGLDPGPQGAFVKGIILTLSNPVTVVFWGSVLTTKIIKENFSKKDLFIFSAGLVSATVFFLSFVSVLGTFLCQFIPEKISAILNVIVGVIIIYSGLKMIIKKEKNNL